MNNEELEKHIIDSVNAILDGQRMWILEKDREHIENIQEMAKEQLRSIEKLAFSTQKQTKEDFINSYARSVDTNSPVFAYNRAEKFYKEAIKRGYMPKEN